MSKRKNAPLLEALREGKSYTWTIPDGRPGQSGGKSILDVVTLNLSLIIYATLPQAQDHARQNTCMNCKKWAVPVQD
jgi:hypothetical protein